MKNNNYLVAVILTVLLSMTSCGSNMVQYSSKKVVALKKAALISTFLAQPQSEEHAYTIDGTLARTLMEMQKLKVDSCRYYVANSMSNYLHCDVLYGENLQKRSDYAEIKQKYEYAKGLETGNPDFPLIVSASNDFSPFKFDVKDMPAFFTPEGFELKCMADIANDLDVDIVAVSYNHFWFISLPAIFEIFQNSIQLQSTVYFFNRKGEHILTLSNRSESITVKNSDYPAYAHLYDLYDSVVTRAFREVDVNNLLRR